MNILSLKLSSGEEIISFGRESEDYYTLHLPYSLIMDQAEGNTAQIAFISYMISADTKIPVIVSKHHVVGKTNPSEIAAEKYTNMLKFAGYSKEVAEYELMADKTTKGQILYG